MTKERFRFSTLWARLRDSLSTPLRVLLRRSVLNFSNWLAFLLPSSLASSSSSLRLANFLPDSVLSIFLRARNVSSVPTNSLRTCRTSTSSSSIGLALMALNFSALRRAFFPTHRASRLQPHKSCSAMLILRATCTFKALVGTRVSSAKSMASSYASRHLFFTSSKSSINLGPEPSSPKLLANAASWSPFTFLYRTSPCTSFSFPLRHPKNLRSMKSQADSTSSFIFIKCLSHRALLEYELVFLAISESFVGLTSLMVTSKSSTAEPLWGSGVEGRAAL
mmetsp:Transcript_18972/g.37951  ORF Transcript_18972/g.37951 Transcript_18972/m.37951 type:complete len:279 (+) Transcript_18972:342-1178(+)